MSRGNKKGPQEMGPMTGRAMGFCAGNDQPGFQAAAPAAGRGNRRGNGRGNGMGNGQGRGPGRGMGRGMGGQGMGRGNRWSQFEPTETPPEVHSQPDSTLAVEVAELKSQLSDLSTKLNRLIDQD